MSCGMKAQGCNYSRRSSQLLSTSMSRRTWMPCNGISSSRVSDPPIPTLLDVPKYLLSTCAPFAPGFKLRPESLNSRYCLLRLAPFVAELRIQFWNRSGRRGARVGKHALMTAEPSCTVDQSEAASQLVASRVLAMKEMADMRIRSTYL